LGQELPEAIKTKTLEIAKEHDINPNLALLIASGTIGEAKAIQLVKSALASSSESRKGNTANLDELRKQYSEAKKSGNVNGWFH
jgi:hypothetical protein